MAAVLALAGAICAEMGAAPSSRCRCSKWPPSSTMAMVTAQLFLSASASAAAAMILMSAGSRTGFDFMGFQELVGRNVKHSQVFPLLSGSLGVDLPKEPLQRSE